MDSQEARNKILSKLKKAQSEGREYSLPSFDSEESVFPKPEHLLDTFKQELELIGGTVHLGNSNEELVKQLIEFCKFKQVKTVFCLEEGFQNLLVQSGIKVLNSESDFTDITIGLTACEYLISRTGTIVVSSGHKSGRRLNVFPPIHVVLAKASQLVSFPDDALLSLEKKYGKDFPSLISFITGASRTADIEKTLVMGAHGPKELLVFINKNE